MSGEYDFYRTRLTHSIEVAQIGRSICNYLNQKSKHLSPDFRIDADLVEAVCLAHDLGHPPFGHSGEHILNDVMRSYGGFEGNAQTLYLLTESLYDEHGARSGMKPTRALIDGVLKYKSLYSELDNPDNHFIYDHQARYLKFVFNRSDWKQQLGSKETPNTFRSVECQIMDWADDTAYSLNDIIDGYRAGFINRRSLERWGSDNNLDKDEREWLEQLIIAVVGNEVERTFSRKIGIFISAAQLKVRKNFMSEQTNRYRFGLRIRDSAFREAHFYKQIAADIVFASPQLEQLRWKWSNKLRAFFSGLEDNYQLVDEPLKLLPEVIHRKLQAEKQPARKMRIICDHVAGMTDGFLIRAYKRMFDPESGSIVDLI